MLWLKKYDDLMFSSFDNKNNVNDAMQLKNDNLPKVIYKYREFSDQTFDALKNDRLYLPAIENLNDPYEGELLASVDELWKHMLVAAVTNLDSEIGNIVEQGLAQIDSKEKGYEFVRYAVQAFDFDNKYTVVHKRFNEDTLGNLFRDIEKRLKKIILEHYRVCSFSSDVLVNKMWSHYANGHKRVFSLYEYLLVSKTQHPTAGNTDMSSFLRNAFF